MVNILPVAVELLGCEVRRRSEPGALNRFRQVRQPKVSCKSEVDDDRLPILPNPDVLWLDIAMNDSFFSKCGKPIAQLRKELNGLTDGPRFSRLQPVRKIGARNELFNDEVALMSWPRGERVLA